MTSEIRIKRNVKSEQNRHEKNTLKNQNFDSFVSSSVLRSDKSMKIGQQRI